jgi:hypothetical protein
MSAVPADKQFLDARMRSLIADNAETNAKALADETRDAIAHFLAVTADLPADHSVAWLAGVRATVAGIASVLLGEPILHGYELAAAVGVPWPIDTRYASLVLSGWRVLYPAIFQPAAAGDLAATYRLDVPGTEPYFAEIAGGAYRELSDAASVECVISMDPVTALLVMSGRLSQWPAIAIGAMTFSGDRPELGPRFADLFVFP